MRLNIPILTTYESIPRASVEEKGIMKSFNVKKTIRERGMTKKAGLGNGIWPKNRARETY